MQYGILHNCFVAINQRTDFEYEIIVVERAVIVMPSFEINLSDKCACLA